MGIIVSLRILARGIDTLYWSTACGIDGERFAALRAVRDRADEDVVIEPAGQWRPTPRGHDWQGDPVGSCPIEPDVSEH